MDTQKRSVESVKRRIKIRTKQYLNDVAVLCSDNLVTFNNELMIADVETPFINLHMTLSQR